MERQNRLFFRHSSKMERLLTIPQTSEDHSQLDHEINLSWRSNLKTSHCISVLKSRMYIVHRYINKNNKTHKPSHTCTKWKQSPDNREHITHITKARTKRREQLQLLLHLRIQFTEHMKTYRKKGKGLHRPIETLKSCNQFAWYLNMTQCANKSEY